MDSETAPACPGPQARTVARSAARATFPPMADTVDTLRMVLGDQCSRGLSSLQDLDLARDVVLMAEVDAECTYVPHHKKKIVLVLSAMRHFARALRARGVRVEYVALDDPANTHTLRGELLRAVAAYAPRRVVVTESGEWRLEQDMRGWQEAAGVEVEVRDDTRFLCRRQEFRAWGAHHGGSRMEFFYRDMRRRYGVLMDGDGPAGGKWNYDAQNRKPLPRHLDPPPVPAFPPDAITQEVMALVARCFPGHFGDVDGFALPVTARDAEAALADFVQRRLALFGDWQDTMKAGESTLYHAVISTSLNCGLLDPLHACRVAEEAWRAGDAPLNAVEGFVRQILGWREFVRGVYWLNVPRYRELNALGAERKLPWFYWTGETRMNCLHHAITDTRRHAYAHHIQRLMVTGNFALMAGLRPDDVDEWYLVVYADAHEWVEMPNTRGVALHADGGLMGSKPYASSGAYINRMSDYCKACSYDVKEAEGDGGCPFNALYWDFMARHRDRFAANPRMTNTIRTLDRMDPARLGAIRARAARFLTAMDAGERV